MTHDMFHQALLTALGPALHHAGYRLDQTPIRWSGGLFCFRRSYDDVLDLVVSFQLLAHPDYPARFQVVLAREGRSAHQPVLPVVSLSLSRLLWDVFRIQVLPAAEHWWQYRDLAGLGDTLLEAGKLLAGYGLPWLDGTLVPPEAGIS